LISTHTVGRLCELAAPASFGLLLLLKQLTFDNVIAASVQVSAVRQVSTTRHDQYCCLSSPPAIQQLGS
jgi:hypothetical protein